MIFYIILLTALYTSQAFSMEVKQEPIQTEQFLTSIEVDWRDNRFFTVIRVGTNEYIQKIVPANNKNVDVTQHTHDIRVSHTLAQILLKQENELQSLYQEGHSKGAYAPPCIIAQTLDFPTSNAHDQEQCIAGEIKYRRTNRIIKVHSALNSR